MTFVDTTPASFSIKLTENDFQQKFADLLTEYGWDGGVVGQTSVASKFKKVALQAPLANGTFGNDPATAKRQVVIANHYIFANAVGKKFGMALLADFSPLATEVPATTDPDFETWVEASFDENKTRTAIYYYMLEKLPTDTLINNAVVGLVWGGDLQQMALDIEVATVKVTGGSYVAYVVDKADPSVMQSPIVVSNIRADFLESVNYPYQQTNWWSDSEIRIQGQIDESSVFVIIQADNVPAWENNIVPSVPFYFGEIDPIDVGDDAVAMFAGTVPPGGSESAVGAFDFSNPNVGGGTNILPILKNYPQHPSNGIDSVMLSRSKFGSRYQEYFLSWNTAPDLMPPDRKNGSKEYPRAWNNTANDEFRYQFNPSRYSGKVHTSKIYVVHPEEGVRGSLTKTIGLSALNFSAGKLRIRKQNCPTELYDVYRFFMVGAVSPLTKRPATPYRPIGLGIYDSEYNPNA